MYHKNGFLTIEACLAVAVLMSMALLIAQFCVETRTLHIKTENSLLSISHARWHVMAFLFKTSLARTCPYENCQFEINESDFKLNELPLTHPFKLVSVKIPWVNGLSGGTSTYELLSGMT